MSPPRDDESPSDDTDPGDRSPRSGDDATDSDTHGGPGAPTDSGRDPTRPSADDIRDADSESGDRLDADPLDPTPADDQSSHDGDPGGHTDDRSGGEPATPNGGVGRVDGPTVGRPDREEESDDSGALRTFVVDVVSSALAVLLVGVLLFAVSGVWPPMVAIESPSMTPHMKTGDLVFVMEEQRFPGDGAVAGTGVVTHQAGQTTDYRKFARSGDVIVYKPDGSDSATPIIHRAMFWVEEGENWYDEANKQAIGRYSECGDSPDEALPNCPAPHAGFITKGDANGVYDQVQSLSGPVKAQWVVGTAEVRIPKLGCIRLRQKGCMGSVRALPGNASVAAGT